MKRLIAVVVSVVCAFLIGAIGGALAADYPIVDADLPIDGTWVHKHSNYPPRPVGKDEINEIFGYVDPNVPDGPICQPRHSAEQVSWRAADEPKPAPKYTFRFHNKLGGDKSSNLDWDVKGHIKNNDLNQYVKSGIWGQLCRYISGTTKVSTHSWGIAVDQNARYEHYGHKHACHSVQNSVANVWSNHKWYWGAKFKGNSKDCMHFQYAKGY